MNSETDQQYDLQIGNPQLFYSSPPDSEGASLRLSQDRFITVQKSTTIPNISMMRVDERKAGPNWKKEKGTNQPAN